MIPRINGLKVSAVKQFGNFRRKKKASHTTGMGGFLQSPLGFLFLILFLLL